MLESLLKKIDEVEFQALEALKTASNEEELTQIDNEFLSKKGKLSDLLKTLKDIDPQDRPKVGARVNEVKKKLEEAFLKKQEYFKEKTLQEKLSQERIDVTLPARKTPIGGLHPVTTVIQEITSIFYRLGFELAFGPEVDNEFYCFDALNIPEDHPARDMQDTFYIKNEFQSESDFEKQSKKVLLRTQTSTVQIRTMLKKKKPPVRIISPGAVFRSDYDQTHSPMFHQIEGLYVDKNVSFAELKGALLFFAREMFGEDTKIRFRPSFFPFVEPGAEVDVWFKDKNNKDGGRWLEILGAGMVHPNVLKEVGYNVNEVSGFAFGMGVERIAMIKYGISDLRLLFENDIRFLRQFQGL